MCNHQFRNSACIDRILYSWRYLTLSLVKAELTSSSQLRLNYRRLYYLKYKLSVWGPSHDTGFAFGFACRNINICPSGLMAAFPLNSFRFILTHYPNFKCFNKDIPKSVKFDVVTKRIRCRVTGAWIDRERSQFLIWNIRTFLGPCSSATLRWGKWLHLIN